MGWAALTEICGCCGRVSSGSAVAASVGTGKGRFRCEEPADAACAGKNADCDNDEILKGLLEALVDRRDAGAAASQSNEGAKTAADARADGTDMTNGADAAVAEDAMGGKGAQLELGGLWSVGRETGAALAEFCACCCEAKACKKWDGC